MVVVNLFTEDGGFVTKLSVPPFHDMPQVIVWGSRTFIRTGLEYREAFTWWAPPGSENVA